MSNHKKIDWLRWHKRKYFIRINCAIMCAILLIVLLLQFPIVHAESLKISDLYHFDSILNSEDALSSLSGEPYQTVLSSTSLRVNPFLDKETAMSYEDKLHDLFEQSVDISSLNNPYMSVLLTSSDSNHLYVCFHESNLSRYCNFDSVTCGLSCSSALVYQYDLTYGSFSYYGTGINWSGQINLNILLSTAPIMYVYYPVSYDSYDYNYMVNDGSCGSGPGGLNIRQPIDSSIIDNEYLGENNFIYCNGSSLNNFEIIIGLDFNNSQKPSDFKYTLDIGLAVDCNISNNAGRNAEKSLLNSYGLNPSGATWNIKFDKTFSNTITDNLSTNVFKIPSTVFNDGLVDSSGYTAVPFCNYVSNYVPRGSLTNELEAFKDHLTGTTLGPFSMPGYTETNYFSEPDVVYNFSLNVYDKNNNLITNVPLATNYNAITGSQTQYSNGGGKSKSEVQNAINQHNENKTPTDSDYKNPDDYTPTISKDNNDSSSNSNSNSSSSSNPISTSNASVTINQPSTYPTTPIMNKFISIIHNEKQGSVDKVESIIESNGYIELCNQALSAVPQPIWDAWTLAIKAILGILVSAFFLKILVNWST